jgi:uncharacterized SAM-binding protein YcdF (DUF218 family)
MFFFLSKFLHLFIQPFTWIILIVAFSILSKKYRKKSIYTALLLFFVFSNKLIIKLPEMFYESRAVELQEETVYDYGIVLGGYSSWDDKRQRTNFNTAVDRLLYGIKLQNQGTVKQLILSGGSGSLDHPEWKEANIMSDFLSDFTLKVEPIIESDSRNTYESALKCKHLLSAKSDSVKVLLFTSAVHMPRAMASFKKQGLNVDIYPVDFIESGKLKWYDAILPDVKTLSNWNKYTHEWIGFLLYKIRGYA